MGPFTTERPDDEVVARVTAFAGDESPVKAPRVKRSPPPDLVLLSYYGARAFVKQLDQSKRLRGDDSIELQAQQLVASLFDLKRGYVQNLLKKAMGKASKKDKQRFKESEPMLAQYLAIALQASLKP
jgi:hypothetical protein